MATCSSALWHDGDFCFITVQGARLGTVSSPPRGADELPVAHFLCPGRRRHAAEALLGKAIGSRDAAGLRARVRRTLAWSLGFAMLSAFYSGWRAPRSSVSSPDAGDPQRRAGIPSLDDPVPSISVVGFFYDACVRRRHPQSRVRVVMTASAALSLSPVVCTRGLGNHGLWLAFTAFMLVRGVGMHLSFIASRTHWPMTDSLKYPRGSAPGRRCLRSSNSRTRWFAVTPTTRSHRTAAGPRYERSASRTVRSPSSRWMTTSTPGSWARALPDGEYSWELPMGGAPRG